MHCNYVLLSAQNSKKAFWLKALLFLHQLHLRSDTLTSQLSLSQYSPVDGMQLSSGHLDENANTVTGADHKPQLPPDKPVQVKTCSCCSAQRPLL